MSACHTGSAALSLSCHTACVTQTALHVTDTGTVVTIQWLAQLNELLTSAGTLYQHVTIIAFFSSNYLPQNGFIITPQVMRDMAIFCIMPL